MFVRAVAVLALPAAAQRAWLDTLPPFTAGNVDELAMEFDDGFQLAPQWVAAGWLAAETLEAATLLDCAR